MPSENEKRDCLTRFYFYEGSEWSVKVIQHILLECDFSATKLEHGSSKTLVRVCDVV